MSLHVPLVADTTALRLQIAGQDEELCFDAQERRLYAMNGVKLGGIAAWHTDLVDVNNKKIIGGVAGATVVNFLQVTASLTGQPVRVQAAGDDTNIQLLVLSKGTSQVLAGRSGQQVPVNQRESDNPATGVNGEQLYRLDLAELFLMRGANTKWLASMRDHLWTFNNNATGSFGRQGALQASATLGVRVDFTTVVTGIGWNLELSGSSPSSAIEIVRCDGVPNVLASQAVGGTLSGFAALDVDMTVTSDYAIRWNDGGSGFNATGYVNLYLRRRALAA